MSLGMDPASNNQSVVNPLVIFGQADNDYANMDVQDESDLLSMPGEVIFNIFKYLFGLELVQRFSVCKKWHKYSCSPEFFRVDNLQKRFQLTVIDEKTWEKHTEISIEDPLPVLTRKEYIKLEKMLIDLKKESLGVTLLTVPKTLNLSKLLEIARSPKAGNKFKYTLYSLDLVNRLNQAVQKTYRVALSDDILKKVRDLSAEEQKSLLKKAGFEMPDVLSQAALLVMRQLSSSEESPALLKNSTGRCRNWILPLGNSILVSFGPLSNLNPLVEDVSLHVHEDRGYKGWGTRSALTL